MISSLEDYVGFLTKHNMSGDQFLFCCLVHEKKLSLIYKIFNERDGFNVDELRDLEDRGFVINMNKDNDLFADMYVVTDKFTSGIYGEDFHIWQEFIDLYPQFIFIDQKRIPAQSTDLDKLRQIYISKISRNINKHKKIMASLRYAVDHDLINMGIQKWVTSEQWKAVELIQNEKSSVGHGEQEF